MHNVTGELIMGLMHNDTDELIMLPIIILFSLGVIIRLFRIYILRCSL